MIWPILVSIILGIVCGIRTPVFSFFLISVATLALSALALSVGGYSLVSALVELVAITVAMQFGYVAGLLGGLALGRKKVSIPVMRYRQKAKERMSA